MVPEKCILKNDSVCAEILLDWGYARSRYDRSATVGQVRVGKHTFLSRESNGAGGVGLGGVGLTNVFEWKDTALYDSIGIADCFPLPGVGLLKKTDMNPFAFNHDYSVEGFEHQYDISDQRVSVRTLPSYCLGTAMDMTKSYTLEGSSLCVDLSVKNVGEKGIHAYEFCHNFIRFDDHPIDSDYRFVFPYAISPLMRRGEIAMGRSAFRPYRFDAPTASSSFWIGGWEGIKEHWVRIENEALGMSVRIEDEFEPCRVYCWMNPDAGCPEVFRAIDLEPGESVKYRRTYSFHVDE